MSELEDQHDRTQAYELRLAGASYQMIADRLSVDADTARSLVVRELRRQAEHDGTAADLEMARLDAMLIGLWPKARRGDLHAIDRVLKISERRAQLLGNAPAPVRVNQQESGLDEFSRRLRARQSGAETADAPR